MLVSRDAVQAEGLQQHYAADTDFALQARMLAAMAFVPAPDVDEAFAELARNANSAIEGWHSALGANAGGHHINLGVS